MLGAARRTGVAAEIDVTKGGTCRSRLETTRYRRRAKIRDADDRSVSAWIRRAVDHELEQASKTA